MTKGSDPMIIALARASADIARILSFICRRRRRILSRFSSVSARLPDEEVELRCADTLRRLAERLIERLAEPHLIADAAELLADWVADLATDDLHRLGCRQAGPKAADDEADRLGEECLEAGDSPGDQLADDEVWQP